MSTKSLYLIGAALLLPASIAAIVVTANPETKKSQTTTTVTGTAEQDPEPSTVTITEAPAAVPQPSPDESGEGTTTPAPAASRSVDPPIQAQPATPPARTVVRDRMDYVTQPDNPAMQDGICTYTFDDGTTDTRFVATRPTPTKTIWVSLECPVY